MCFPPTWFAHCELWLSLWRSNENQYPRGILCLETECRNLNRQRLAHWTRSMAFSLSWKTLNHIHFRTGSLSYEGKFLTLSMENLHSPPHRTAQTDVGQLIHDWRASCFFVLLEVASREDKWQQMQVQRCQHMGQTLRSSWLLLSSHVLSRSNKIITVICIYLPSVDIDVTNQAWLRYYIN